MITRIFLLLAVAMLPLCAQSSVNGGDRVLPDRESTVQPTAPSGPATMQPGVDRPPEGIPAPPPEMPAMPRVRSYITAFSASPGTFREGMDYKGALHTTIKLNAPAPHRMVFHVISSDETKVRCTDVVFIKNSQTSTGGIGIVWGAVLHDTSFVLKAYSTEDPDTVMTERIYLKKKIN